MICKRTFRGWIWPRQATACISLSDKSLTLLKSVSGYDLFHVCFEIYFASFGQRA